MSETRAKNTWSPSRRTLVKGAAWTAPAVVIATAAPAYAATRPPVAPPTDADGCKYSGSSTAWDKTYRVQLCFTNTLNEPATVNVTGLTWNGETPNFPPSPDGFFSDPQFCDSDGGDAGLVADNCVRVGDGGAGDTFVVPANGQFCFWIFFRSTDSRQESMCFTYTYTTTGGTTPATACTAFHFDPDCKCTSPQPPYAKDTPGKC